MKAALIEEKDKLRIIDIAIPEPSQNEVLIEVYASGICGTDLHIFKGDYRGTYPIIPGHELAGIVRSAGSSVQSFKEGDRVTLEPNLSCGVCYDCLNNRQHFCSNIQNIGVTRPGGMAQFVTAPESAVFSIGALSFEEASFMEPLSCVLHGIDRLDPELGDTVLLMGAGPIGLLLLQSLYLTKCSRIDVVDKDSDRLKLAKKMGAHTVYSDLSNVSLENYHIVCDATGVSFLMEESVNYVRPSGKILWFGVPNVKAEVRLNPFRLFEKEISILSTYTSCRNSWQALHLMQNNRLNLKDLISHRLPLDEFEKGLKILETHSEPVMKVLVMPQL